MKNSHEKTVEPLRMLPRFNSQVFLLEQISQSNLIHRYNPLSSENLIFHDIINKNKSDQNFLISQTISHPQLTNSLLPRFYSDHRRNYYDENQSADTTGKLNNDEVQETNYHSNKFDIKFLERIYDRSGKKCWPTVNTNIGKFDLEYVYGIVGDTLESYIHYRKLNRCKVLSNFIEYRNKVYKREKIAQYKSSKTKVQMKEIQTKQTTNIPPKIIKLEEKQSLLVPPSPSARSATIPSSPSIISETSQKQSSPTSKEAFIPIPSPDLLTSPTRKQSNMKVQKKTSGNIKQSLSPSVKGQS